MGKRLAGATKAWLAAYVTAQQAAGEPAVSCEGTLGSPGRAR
jgi:hypothetical protein